MVETVPHPMKSPTLVLLALLGAATALAGCGKSESEAAGDAVVAYLNAFATGDGAKACEMLTDETKKVIVPAVGRKVGARDCPAAIRRLRTRLTVPQTDAFRRATATRVNVRDDVAEVRFRAGSLRGAAELRKSGDDWKISLLPKTG